MAILDLISHVHLPSFVSMLPKYLKHSIFSSYVCTCFNYFEHIDSYCLLKLVNVTWQKKMFSWMSLLLIMYLLCVYVIICIFIAMIYFFPYISLYPWNYVQSPLYSALAIFIIADRLPVSVLCTQLSIACLS